MQVDVHRSESDQSANEKPRPRNQRSRGALVLSKVYGHLDKHPEHLEQLLDETNGAA